MLRRFVHLFNIVKASSVGQQLQEPYLPTDQDASMQCFLIPSLLKIAGHTALLSFRMWRGKCGDSKSVFEVYTLS